MFISSFFHHVNWLALIVSALGYFIIGALWFSPVLFSKVWQAEHKIVMSEEDRKKVNIPLMMLTTLVLNIIITLGVAMIVMAFKPDGARLTALTGAKIGILVGGMIAAVMGMTYMYLGKSIKIWIIDSMYHVLGVTMVAVVLTVWH